MEKIDIIALATRVSKKHEQAQKQNSLTLNQGNAIMPACAKCKSSFISQNGYAYCSICRIKIKKANKITIQENLKSNNMDAFKNKKYNHNLKVH